MKFMSKKIERENFEIHIKIEDDDFWDTVKKHDF